MSRIAYVNGRYVPHASARVHVEDRGYQFADGVYEVTAVVDGKLVDHGPHLERLDRSLRALRIAWPMSPAALTRVEEEVVRRNRVREGIVYLQVTRGVARRDHAFPVRAAPALVVTARHAGPPKTEQAEKGVKVILHPDIRWGRCDIKSVALLPNVLAKQAAREAGAFEAWLVDAAGFVTEGSSTNAWIVDPTGNLVTRNLENAILSGVTRRILLELAAAEGHRVVKRPFTPAEAKAAPEAFLTSTTSFVMPVVQIDEAIVGAGAPGPVTRRLRELYEAHVGRG